MIQIKNIGGNLVSVLTSDASGKGQPNVVKLRPGTVKLMSKGELKQWPKGAKVDMANYVTANMLELVELTLVHNYIEKSTKTEFTAIDLQSAINDAVAYKAAFNQHVENATAHTAADTNILISPDPTDLPELITLMIEALANHDLHIVTAVHVTVDTWNDAPVIVVADLPSSILAIKAMITLLHSHKTQTVPNTTPTMLTPAQIIAYS